MKQVNDRDGHAAGDHVLKTLVWTMRSNLRSFDPIVRYGATSSCAALVESTLLRSNAGSIGSVGRSRATLALGSALGWLGSNRTTRSSG